MRFASGTPVLDSPPHTWILNPRDASDLLLIADLDKIPIKTLEYFRERGANDGIWD